MKFLLINLIRFYWTVKPKNKLPRCIFRKSCSSYVYEITREKGFYKGVKALRFRIKNCNYGFELYKNPETKKTEMLLPDKTIIEEKNIAERLLNNL